MMCEVPKFALTPAQEVHTVAPVGEVEHHSPELAACLATAKKAKPSGEFYAVLNEVPFDQFGALTNGTKESGRLRARFWQSLRGTIALPPIAEEFTFTAGSDGACKLVRAADGAIRCLPSALPIVDMFAVYADSACVTPVGIAVTGEESKQVLSDSDEDGLVHLYEVGEPHTGPLYSRSPEGGCTEANFNARSFVAGAEISPSEFVKYELKELP
jgi:hypothetical protein